MTLPDGFVQIESAELRDLTRNAGGTVNEFSPFANHGEIVRRSDELIVDQHYGLAYHLMELRPAAIYGRTVDLPVYSGDHLANHGFLRVPFRRIPRRIVRSRAEIEELVASIKSADADLPMLFRGQTREHFIARSSETTQWLYGEESVKEPSLTTSASRRTPTLEDVLPEWSMLLRIFLSGMPAGSKQVSLLTSFGFPLFALALAQHYGLPTSGLDVTDRLDVALFFALMEYHKAPGGYGATYSPAVKSSQMPVLYILFPPKQQQFDYESFRTEGFPYSRPDAQSARFMHMAWGYADNLCACRIFLALYLDPAGDFGLIPTPAELFPAGTTDLFAAFLEGAHKRVLPDKLACVLKEGFYTIQT
jgi:hypothetical protein